MHLFYNPIEYNLLLKAIPNTPLAAEILSLATNTTLVFLSSVILICCNHHAFILQPNRIKPSLKSYPKYSACGRNTFSCQKYHSFIPFQYHSKKFGHSIKVPIININFCKKKFPAFTKASFQRFRFASNYILLRFTLRLTALSDRYKHYRISICLFVFLTFLFIVGFVIFLLFSESFPSAKGRLAL